MNATRVIMAALMTVGLLTGSTMAQTKAAAPAAGNTEDVFLKKGTVLFGGSLDWNMVDNGAAKSEKESELSIAPEINYFFMDNLSLGLIGSVAWYRQKNQGTLNSTTFLGELVARYYFPLCNSRIMPYVGATAGAGIDNWNIKVNNGVDISGKTTTTTYGPQAGFLMPLTDSVMLDTRVSYKHTNFNGDDAAWRKDQNEVAMSMGIMVKL